MKKIIIILAVIGCLSGCSSIVSKNSYPVVINSQPDAAPFKITNKSGQVVHSGNTPATVNLKSSAGYFSGESYQVHLTKPGYRDRVFTLTSTIDGWYFGNLLAGGLIGMLIIDPITGSMWNLPVRADISLYEERKSAQNINQQLQIKTLDSLSDDQVVTLEKIK